jgi:pimeloyl-ACP methyl ester carboxylesterase
VDQPGRLGQYQADLAWLEDSGQLDRLGRITSPCLAMAFEHDCWFPPRVVVDAAKHIPDAGTSNCPASATAPPC